MGVTDQLRQLRQDAGLSIRGLADKLGMPSSTYVAYERADLFKKRTIPLELAERIADVIEQHGVPRERVLELAGIRPPGTTLPAPADMAAQLGLAMIPEVDIAYSMGGGSVVGDYAEARMVPFRSDWLARLTRGGPADVFLTRGSGDSMMPTLLDDDDVLVNRADCVIREQDRIWALGYGDLGLIKRVRRLPGGAFQLNSDNHSVTPIEATEDELFVVGRVIWIGRRA